MKERKNEIKRAILHQIIASEARDLILGVEDPPRCVTREDMMTILSHTIDAIVDNIDHAQPQNEQK